MGIASVNAESKILMQDAMALIAETKLDYQMELDQKEARED